jgi:predicted ribosomally synthesized peptide with nif11-like leader
MSAESIASFRSKVSSNNALQISLTEAVNSGPEAVIALGAANGFNFDASDIQAATSAGDLTDFELGLVSGGFGVRPHVMWGRTERGLHGGTGRGK